VTRLITWDIPITAHHMADTLDVRILLAPNLPLAAGRYPFLL